MPMITRLCDSASQELEQLLPRRPETASPCEDSEEVTMMDFEQSNSGGNSREAYREDDEDDDHPGGGPSVQCAHQ